MRKLVDLTSCTCARSTSSRTAGCIPATRSRSGTSFLALVSWFSGVDPGIVVRHEPSLLAPLAVRRRLGGRRRRLRLALGGLVGRSSLSLAVFCFGPGHGGSYATLALPGTAARQLLVPAAIALFFWSPAARRSTARSSARSRSRIRRTRSSCSCRSAATRSCARGEWRTSAPLLAAALVPTALVLLWLKPIVDETVSHDPGPGERLRGLAHYGDQLVVRERAPLPPRGRGASAAAAPSPSPRCSCCRWRRSRCAAAGRRSRSAGSLVVLLLTEVPWLFVHFSDAVSLSQSRRVAGFAPLPFALVGALALLARSRLVLPAALVAGIVLQRLWPGDFEYGLRHGGPAAATWIALVGGAIALVAGVDPADRDLREHHALGAAAAACFVLPVFVHGLWHWSPRVQERSARALAAARAPPAHRRAEGRGRDRAGQDELPGRGRRRRSTSSRCAGHARREHEGERPVRPRARGAALGADERPARRHGATAPPGRSAAAVSIVSRNEGAARHPLLPARGGGGVQRPLKFATHLPELGIETHVLAPDDPKWIHRDDELPPPTLAWVHRARYLGPKGRKPAEELHGTTGPRAVRRAGAARRAAAARARRERQLEPDRDPGRDPHRRGARGSTS